MPLTSERRKPFQSKLVPVAEVIAVLRKQRKTFVEISRILREQHGISAAPSGIHNFVKVRSKSRRIYEMIETTPLQPTLRPVSAHDAIEKLKQSKPAPEPPKLFTYDENKPLTLIHRK